MPKKSRREKLRRDLRRRVRTERVLTVPPPEVPTVAPTSTFHFTASASPKHQSTSLIQTDELMAIKSDLRKIIILAVIAVGAELAIFWLR